MGYIAQSDPIFCDGFYVEDHDLRNWTDIAEPLRRIVESEAKAGNKVSHTQRDVQSHRIDISLSGPARSDLSRLPETVALYSTYDDQYRVYDSELYVIYHLQSGDAVRFSDPEHKWDNDFLL